MTLDRIGRYKVKKDIHVDFFNLLVELQTNRIKIGTDGSQEKTSIWWITKLIYNMINANKEMFDKLSEVKVNVKS